MEMFLLIYVLCGAVLTVWYGYKSAPFEPDRDKKILVCFFFWWVVVILISAEVAYRLGTYLRNKRNKNRG